MMRREADLTVQGLSEEQTPVQLVTRNREVALAAEV